eukprot:803707_1
MVVYSIVIFCLIFSLSVVRNEALSYAGLVEVNTWGGVNARHRRIESATSTQSRFSDDIVLSTAIEKTRSSSSAPAILERPVQENRIMEEPTKDKKIIGNEAWEVRIYNDGLNTREHVARCLVQVTGLTEIEAYQTMMQAHHNGMAVVGLWVFERAEMYHDALKKKGIFCDMVPVDESDS